MPVRDYDPRQGQAFQGDLAIIPVPDDVAIATDRETRPVDGRLILQLGMRNGCDHAISPCDTPTGTAHFYGDRAAAEQMVTRGLLTRSDIAIGCLVVTGGAIVISHPEHDGIRIPSGNYLVVEQTSGPFLGEPFYI